MSINKQALKLHGITEGEYKNWCRSRRLNVNSLNTKEQFFRWVNEGRIIRDKNGFLIKKSEKDESQQ